MITLKFDINNYCVDTQQFKSPSSQLFTTLGKVYKYENYHLNTEETYSLLSTFRTWNSQVYNETGRIFYYFFRMLKTSKNVHVDNVLNFHAKLFFWKTI